MAARPSAAGSTSVRTAVNHALRPRSQSTVPRSQSTVPRSQSTVPRSQRAVHGACYGCAESYADRRVVGLVGIGRDACSSATSSLADGRRDGSLCKSDSTIDTSSCEYLQVVRCSRCERSCDDTETAAEPGAHSGWDNIRRANGKPREDVRAHIQFACPTRLTLHRHDDHCTHEHTTTIAGN